MKNQKTLPISPTSALLLLVKGVQEEKSSPEEARAVLQECRHLLMSGGMDKIDALLEKCNSYLPEPLNIHSDPEFINEDPVRRFFETSLAKETLLTHVHELDLKEKVDALAGKIKRFLPEDNHLLMLCQAQRDTLKVNDEIRDALYRIRYYNHSAYGYSDFPFDNKIQMQYLWQWIYYSLVAVEEMATLVPHNEIFLRDFAARGRQEKYPKGTPIYSMHLGLMKSIMPLPHHDSLRVSGLFYHKRSESSLPVSNPFNDEMFEAGVHPFSNSLSATLLAVIRASAWMEANEEMQDADKPTTAIHPSCSLFARLFACHARNRTAPEKTGMEMEEKRDATPSPAVPQDINFFRCMISAMLYNSGGHSLYEFASVFQLSGLSCEEVTLQKLFIEDNETAFDRAIQSTLKYQDQWFARKRVIEELEHHPYFLYSRTMGKP